MDTLLKTSSYLLQKSPKPTMISRTTTRFNPNYSPNPYPFSSSSFSGQFSLQNKPKKPLSMIVNARKKDKKEDNHSFVPKSDEDDGFFPESVLLKKKAVEEEGEILSEFEDDDERELYESLRLKMESYSGVELLRHYEVVYLIHEEHEEEVAAVNEKIQDFFREKKGKVWRFNDWGMRKLAYKIKKANNAHYILMNFEIDAKYINEFKTLLDKDERVIRHLLIKRDEAITEDCPPPPEFNTFVVDDEEFDEEFDDFDWDDEDEKDDFEEDDEEEEGDEGIYIIDDEDLV